MSKADKSKANFDEDYNAIKKAAHFHIMKDDRMPPYRYMYADGLDLFLDYYLDIFVSSTALQEAISTARLGKKAVQVRLNDLMKPVPENSLGTSDHKFTKKDADTLWECITHCDDYDEDKLCTDVLIFYSHFVNDFRTHLIIALSKAIVDHNRISNHTSSKLHEQYRPRTRYEGPPLDWRKRESLFQDDAAMVLQVDRRTIYSYIKKGLLKLTKNKRVLTESLKNFFENRP